MKGSGQELGYEFMLNPKNNDKISLVILFLTWWSQIRKKWEKERLFSVCVFKVRNGLSHEESSNQL